MDNKEKLKNSDASIVSFALSLLFLIIILIAIAFNPGENPVLAVLMIGSWFSSLIISIIDLRKQIEKKL